MIFFYRFWHTRRPRLAVVLVSAVTGTLADLFLDKKFSSLSKRFGAS